MEGSLDVAGPSSHWFSSAQTRTSYLASQHQSVWMENLEQTTGDGGKKRPAEDNKQNHSEIEKQRRDKMNKHIVELSALVPMCSAMSRKLDKLTVLRMAVQHITNLRGSVHSYKEGQYKPRFLSDEDLKKLILRAAEGFLFVVSCDRGRILFISESVSQVLHYSQEDLLGQSWFDILHPKDVPQVKEQLSSADFFPKERLIDAKTMLPVMADVPSSQHRLSPGSRRSFFCRMKCKTLKEETNHESPGSYRRRKSSNFADREYVVVHCTGYLKLRTPSKLEHDREPDNSANTSCLVAIGQAYQNPICPVGNLVDVRQMEFVSRHASDGKFLFVDQRATMYLGYLPQELVGIASHEYYHRDDVNHVTEMQKQAVQSLESLTSDVYRFRRKDGTFASLRTRWKSFKNPWTRDFEFVVAINYLVASPSYENHGNICNAMPGDREKVISPSSVMSGSRQHRGINEDAAMQGSCRNSHGNSLGQTLPPDGRFFQFSPDIHSKIASRASPAMAFNNVSASNSTVKNTSFDSTTEAKSEVTGSVYAANGLPESNDNCWEGGSPTANNETESEAIDSIMGREMAQASYQNSSNEGNDEAAMSLIMSLLEADAGLGPVDFSGLPWPLP